MEHSLAKSFATFVKFCIVLLIVNNNVYNFWQSIKAGLGFLVALFFHYPRDAMLAQVIAMARCLSVYKSKRLNQPGWLLAWELLSTCPTLYCKEIRITPEIRYFPSGTLLQTVVCAVADITGGPCKEFSYVLEQFNLHWGEDDSAGSEHLINSTAYPAEVSGVLLIATCHLATYDTTRLLVWIMHR